MINTNLVSVIIPTYNRLELLKEAINSVHGQIYRPIECIVVDDGSTDDTQSFMQEFSKLNNNGFTLIYIKQENAGSQVARNRGTAVATGEFIQYLDSDDLLYKEKLVKQVNYLLEHPNCDAVFGDWEKGEKEKKDIVKGYANDDMMFQMLVQQPIHTLSILFRRNLVVRIGEWDTAIKRNQEIDFHLRGVLQGAVYHYQEHTTGLWRTHEGERIFSKTNFSSAIAFYKKWETILLENNVWNEKFREGVAKNYFWFLNTYSTSERKEMNLLLHEIYRLQPQHPLFQTAKFKLLRRIAGLNTAINFWIKRFQINKNEQTKK